MNDCLIGCTGFVGGNLARSHSFSACYHSTDITQSYGSKPQLVVYAGVKAEKFLANSDPEKDYQTVMLAYENLLKIQPEKVVLISTADVYKNPQHVNECTSIETTDLHAYGFNRFCLEKKVRQAFPDALIIRLPALYGEGLKKNFLFDLLTITPSMLKEPLYQQLSEKSRLVQTSYHKGENGFYQLNSLSQQEAANLRSWFAKNDFNATSFTDSRAVYQFYPLSRLWKDIEIALREDLRLLNITTAPLSAAEIAKAVSGIAFSNEIAKEPVFYDIQSHYATLFGGQNGYFINRETTLAGLTDSTAPTQNNNRKDLPL